MRRSIWWPLIILVSAAGVGWHTFADIQSPIRLALSVWFLLLCPGMAYIQLLRLQRPWAEWTLAISLSIALNIILTEAMILSGMWSPKWGLAVLIGISLSGAVLQIVQAYARPLPVD